MNNSFYENLDPLIGITNNLSLVKDDLLAPLGDISWNSIFSSLNEEFEDSLTADNADTTAIASVNNLPVAQKDTLMNVSQDAESNLRVFILDPEQLKLTKQLVQNQDPRIAPAIAQLKQQADRALNQKPLTVVDGQTPPSGDPHDYMSLSIYWWPNPNTPDGLPYVHRDGEVNPEVNQYDGPKLNLMAQSVETLALAYYFTDYEPYAEHAARLIKTWFLDEETRMNPNLNHGQAIPGKNDGSRQGIIETAVLATKVIDSVGLLAASEHWTETDQTQLQSWFGSYRQWLQTSWLGIQEAFRTNNHGMWYDVQLTSFARFMGDDASAKRQLTFVTPLRIMTQVESDGSQPQELSRTRGFDYSLYNLDAMFTLASIGEKLDVDLWKSQSEGGRIEKALNFLVPYIEPAKEWPYGQENIRPERLRPFLRRAALAYEDPRYEQLSEQLPGAENERAVNRVNLLYPPELVSSPLQGTAASTEANEDSIIPVASIFDQSGFDNVLDVAQAQGLPQEGISAVKDQLTSDVPFNELTIDQNLFGDSRLNVSQLLTSVAG